MKIPRRDVFKYAGLASSSLLNSKAATTKPGMPGPFPGRVVGVEHPACIVGGVYQAEPVRKIMEKGMTALTGAPSWTEAWRTFFEKGDIVGIKVSPVGGAKLCSDAAVLHSILNGLKAAGLADRDIIVFSRYRQETLAAGIDKWVPPGVRMAFAAEAYNDEQLDMDGYDPDHFMEMALIKPGENLIDPRYRRSYVCKVVTRQINKFINLPVLKHHQSAGVTIALKNMSHGMVNNVNRSHAATGGATDPGPHPAQHELHRVDDLDLPQPLDQREELAERRHGPTLVRRRPCRGRQAVPPRQRPPTPTSAASRPPAACRRAECRCRTS